MATLDNPAGPGYPLRINNSRQIAGFYVDSTDYPHGSVWSNGVFTTVDDTTPGHYATDFGGINDNNQMVGQVYTADGFYHGLMATCNSEVSDVFGPGLGTATVGINDSGEITGMYAVKDPSTGNVYSDGFLLTNGTVTNGVLSGTFTSIDAPGGASHLPSLGTKIFSLSNDGILAGDYETPCDPSVDTCDPEFPFITHGFLFDPNTDQYTSIFVPGSDLGSFGTQVVGVNDSGTAIGVYSDSSGVFHGFVYQGGQYYNLDYPGGFSSELHGINDNGDMTGGYLDASGNPHGFVVFATPEPNLGA